MSVKERLWEYRDLVLYIRQLEQDIDHLYAKATSLQMQREVLGTRIQLDSQADTIGDIVAELTDIARLLEQKMYAAKEKRNGIDMLIRGLSYRDKLLIDLRYFKGCSWDEVAISMNYSLQHIYRLHGEILQNLEG